MMNLTLFPNSLFMEPSASLDAPPPAYAVTIELTGTNLTYTANFTPDDLVFHVLMSLDSGATWSEIAVDGDPTTYAVPSYDLAQFKIYGTIGGNDYYSNTVTYIAPPVGTSGDSGSGILNFTYSGSNPEQWWCEESADGATGWVHTDSEPGDQRIVYADSGNYARVQGRDSLNNPVTDWSEPVLLL